MRCYAALKERYPAPFPPLVFSGRKREFNYYTEEQRASVVYAWLKPGMATRDIDKRCLSLDWASNGYQCMNILHFIGLTRKHQGFFRDATDAEMVSYLGERCADPYMALILQYLIDHLENTGVNIHAEIWRAEDRGERERLWLGEGWLDGTPERDINTRLESLPDDTDSYVVRDRRVYYSSKTKKECVKGIYDYHCQVCDEVVLKTGWTSGLDRRTSWMYLDADVHHILPVSRSGPDTKDNMLCLCPTCHRKFHTGELRLKNSNSGILCVDELLGKVLDFRQRHKIVLY